MRSPSRASHLRPAPPAAGKASTGARARWSSIRTAAFGALLGGLVGGFLVVGVTLVLKAGMDFVAVQETWFIIVAPLVGLSVAVSVLYGIGTSATSARGRKAHPWRRFSPEVARADISADVVNSAGEEERFPWRLAPIRMLAILATVGSGAAMGDRGARRLPGHGGRRLPRRSLRQLAPVSPPGRPRRRSSRRVRAHGDPPRGDGLHAGDRPAPARALERRTCHSSAGRRNHRLGEDRKSTRLNSSHM